jgi:hypothetical protein
MLHSFVPAPASTLDAVAALLAGARSDLLRPLTPAGYLRLRRAAIGLTIEQVAARISPTTRGRTVVGRMLRDLERDEVKVLSIDTLRPLARAIPMDLDVYAQLRDEPVDRHPRVCRGCGCSAYDACVDRDLRPCRWATPDLCSACDPLEAR